MFTKVWTDSSKSRKRHRFEQTKSKRAASEEQKQKKQQWGAMTPSIEKQHQRQKESEMSRNTNDCWSFCGRLVCSEGGRASGRSVSQSERQGTSYSFSRLVKAVDYIYVCVCVCVDSLAFWKGPPCPVQPCGTNNVCRTSSLRSPWNLQPIPRPMSASPFLLQTQTTRNDLILYLPLL